MLHGSVSTGLEISEVSQLVVLGPHLYNGLSGIAVFLAAHACVTGRKSSEELALAAVSHLRKDLSSRNSARLARSLGIGGAVGLGSIVYALALMSKLLHHDALLADAQVGAALFTDDLIASDKQLDVMSGSAGGILGLLRVYRDSQAGDVLQRAARCGEHLLAQRRVGPEGRRSWIGQGLGPQPLNGMSHGAAGFAYALAELAAVTGREEFATAAAECIAFENSTFDEERSNWPDLREAEGPRWASQWCHGAAGIGLARGATAKRMKLGSELLLAERPQGAARSRKRRWQSGGYALLRHNGSHRVPLGSEWRAWAGRSSRPSIAALGRRDPISSLDRRLPMGCRKEAA